MRKTPLKRKTRLKAKGKPRFRKGRDPQFLAWVRTLGCSVGDFVDGWYGGVTEAAHVHSRGAGGVDIGNVIPLCRRHHRQQHQIGRKSFEIAHGMDLAAIAKDLAKRYGKGTAA